MVKSHEQWRKALGKLEANGGVHIWYSPYGSEEYLEFESWEKLREWEMRSIPMVKHNE